MLDSNHCIRAKNILATASLCSLTLNVLQPLSLAGEVALNTSALPSEGFPTYSQDLYAQKSGAKKNSGSKPKARRPSIGAGSGALTRPAPGFDRGNRRPANGWVDRVPAGTIRPLRPRPGVGSALDRPNPNWGRPSWNRPGWNRPNWVFSRPVRINQLRSRPAWWGPRWSSSRPWRYGWYNSGYNSRWNWWNSSSTAWGISSLAGAAIIGAAINNAIRDNRPTIEVNDSPYQLDYGSVIAVGTDNVSFSFLFANSSYEAEANCRQGNLNGRIPTNPEEARLMNAACQVAFGSF